jgi:hypothetical protein
MSTGKKRSPKGLKVSSKVTWPSRACLPAAPLPGKVCCLPQVPDDRWQHTHSGKNRKIKSPGSKGWPTMPGLLRRGLRTGHAHIRGFKSVCRGGLGLRGALGGKCLLSLTLDQGKAIKRPVEWLNGDLLSGEPCGLLPKKPPKREGRWPGAWRMERKGGHLCSVVNCDSKACTGWGAAGVSHASGVARPSPVGGPDNPRVGNLRMLRMEEDAPT